MCVWVCVCACMYALCMYGCMYATNLADMHDVYSPLIPPAFESGTGAMDFADKTAYFN